MTTPSVFAGSLRTAGRKFYRYDPIVATTVYHWFTPDTGNLSGPWLPLEGRQSWTGEPNWWSDQLKQMMLANFDVIYVHLIDRFEPQRVNLFRAYAELRAAGYDLPKIAPFLDPFGLWCANPIDVATPPGKDTFAAQYIRFFQQYFDTNTDQFAGSYLARIEDRLLLSTWWVLHRLLNLEKFERADVEDRLRNAFPNHGEVVNNGIWMASTSLIEPDLSFSDERTVMFSGLNYCVQSCHNDIRTYHLQAGYSDQNIRRPGLFMPRAGGSIYKNVWDFVADVVAPDVHRVYVESWNEYDEGSGIYAADPNQPYFTDHNQTRNTDQWSSSGDPFEYIRTTREGASRINRLPLHDARILCHQCPSTWARGSAVQVRFCVRNQGNALWTAKDGIGFGMRVADFSIEQMLTGLDSPDNEIDRFGGIFRGRPVTFQGSIMAPVRSGTYRTLWSMFREENGVKHWFGENLDVPVTVI